MNLPQLLSTRPKGVVLSPTQLDVFDLCQRKWAFQYILGIQTPQHPSAAFGSEVHGHLERWLKAATPPPADTHAGLVALKMLANLPPPGTGATERRFFMQTQRGHNYTGVIDWTGVFNDRPTVIDHKTTGNFSYAKTEESLLFDTQGIIYASAGLVGFNTDSIDLFWNYGSTGKRIETRPVKTVIHLPIVSERFEILEDTAAEMLALHAQRPDPQQLPPTATACGAFGGCPFQSRCNLTAEERIRGIMSNEPTLTMAERMRQQQAAAAGGGNGVPMPGAQQTMPQPMPDFSGQLPQQPWPAPAAFNPEGGPNPPESGQSIPQAAPVAPPAAAPTDAGKGPGRPRGAKNKLKGAGELPTTEQWAYMIGVQAALNGGPQSVEVLVQAGDLALAAFKAKFGGA